MASNPEEVRKHLGSRLEERDATMPDSEQTIQEVEAYYRNAEVGDIAVVRATQHLLLKYTVTKIEGRNPKLGRVYIPNFGAFYMKHGKNCFHPKGQTMLVVPTARVLDWAEKNPRGFLR